MSVLAISYPVTEGVKQTINRYPAIGRALIGRPFCLTDSRHSEFDVIRLLSNTHYDDSHRRLEFIDRWLDISGPIGRKILRAKDPFRLEQVVAELETFVHLYERFGTAVQAVEDSGNSKIPDIEIRFDDWRARVEVYTPVDLYGFQLFEKYIRMVLKYMDVSCGYYLKVTTQPLQQTSDYDQALLDYLRNYSRKAYYPYTIPKEEDETHKWLKKFAERARQWLGSESPTQTFRMPGPGDEVEIVVEIVKQHSDPGNRQICLIPATRSTDTSLFFEVGTPEDTVKSQWGSKLKGKLKDQQCGGVTEGVLRILLVNFAMVDSGWPHFISEEKFGMRFREVIGRLDSGKQHYDVVLPAQLGYECCFGRPVWINANWKLTIGDFFANAGLDRLCVPPPDSTLKEIEEEIEEFLSVSDPEAENTN